jgi:hypothetical protein
MLMAMIVYVEPAATVRHTMSGAGLLRTSLAQRTSRYQRFNHPFMSDATQYPTELLSDVIWRFWQESPYDDQAIFAARVTEWGRSVSADEPYDWDPAAVAIRAPRVRVKYFGADPEDEFEYADYEATLVSADDQSFTNAELLFRLHNAVVERLRAVDHCHLEGLDLVDVSEAGEPIYEMRQGS